MLKTLEIEMDIQNIAGTQTQRISNPMKPIDKIKQKLLKQDFKTWAEKLQVPQDDYAYPANLEKSIRRMESQYLIPDHDLINKYPGIIKQNDQSTSKQTFSLRTDLYELIAPKYGISIPFYFTLIKIHIAILLIIGGIFGVFFCMKSNFICDNFNDEDKYIDEQQCTYGDEYFAMPQTNVQIYLQKYESLDLYVILACLAYFFSVISPFIHEIFIRVMEFKYWDYEQKIILPFDTKKMVFLQHMPQQMKKEEIIEAINQKCLKNGNKLIFFDNNSIEEITYIYNFNEIILLNEQRRIKFIQIMKLSLLIKNKTEIFSKEDLNNYKDQFITCISEIIILTKEVEIYQNKFQNKVLLKMSSYENADMMKNLFKKNKFSHLYSNIKGMQNTSNKQIKPNKIADIIDTNEDIQEKTNEDFQIKIEQNISLDNSSEDSSQEGQLDVSIQGENSIDSKSQSLKLFMENDFIIQLAQERIVVEENSQHKESYHQMKHMILTEPPQKNDIFWQNIGLHSSKQLYLEIITSSIALISFILCFGSFEYLFYYENRPDNKDQILDGNVTYSQKVKFKLFIFFIQLIFNLLNGLSVLLSLISIITCIQMILKSQKDSYSSQEKLIIIFMSYSSILFISVVPFILVLTQWDGLNQAISVYNLILLCRVRIFAKSLYMIYNHKNIGFWYRKKNILKNNTENYYQKQLDQLLTPPEFPLRYLYIFPIQTRMRLYFVLFIFYTGVFALFLCPFIIWWCIATLLFFYFFDQYSVVKRYKIDKYFSFDLSKTIIRQQ